MTTSAAVTASPRAVESRDPMTGEVWRSYVPAGREEVERAMAAARRAQPEWAARPVSERAAAVERFRRALYRRRDEATALIHRESGKPAAEALVTEVMVVLDLARYYARESVRRLEQRWFTPANIALWRKRVRIAHEPYGVIGVIAPWNYPLMLPAGTVLSAIVTGNAVLLKPSEYTPSTGGLIAELCGEAGVPDGLVAVLPGAGDTGAALIAAGPDKLFFTGSAATGRKVAATCAERMIPHVLELGGSDPAIVLEDAPLDNAVSGILWGRFSNAGQTCVAPKRALVAAPVYDRFVERMASAVSRLQVGPSAAGAHDVGPLIRPWQAEHLRAQLDDAVARGARVVARGTVPADTAGAYFPPTVLADVTPEMRVMREESFGPLLPVMRVADAEDAVARANASMFGLSASIWSRDVPNAIRLAERVEAGTVTINDAIMAVGIAEVPHGGVKESGTGRAHGVEGLMECVRSKAVVVDRLVGVRQPWWFGYDAERARNLDAFVRFWHGRTPAERLGGVWRSLKLLTARERPL
ncbi:MAG TPA: aldehyde dehydrogenase family protein [Gemmatimonadaceae bacterium]|nr:aldehyde dehydrogenase family protein [Gemmatimonadaceae bacterium]